jgi:hypothetical protein
MQIEARSVSYDSAGQSATTKQKASGQAPTDAEFAMVEAQQRENKTWGLAGPNWRCACCDRSRREICRKSNKGVWTARIHRIAEYESEERVESLIWRRPDARSQIVIGSYKHVLICHDCRNIVAETQRRKPGLTEHSLTVENLRDLVGGGTPHTPHSIDYDLAISMAIANAPLLEAIDDYSDHRSKAIQTQAEAKELMRLMNWDWQQARNIIGYEHAKANNLELEEGDAFADWLLAEGRRFLEEFRG